MVPQQHGMEEEQGETRLQQLRLSTTVGTTVHSYESVVSDRQMQGNEQDPKLLSYLPSPN